MEGLIAHGPTGLITPGHYQPHTGLSLKGESARLQSFTLSQGPISALASLSAIKSGEKESNMEGGVEERGTEKLFHAPRRKRITGITVETSCKSRCRDIRDGPCFVREGWGNEKP